MSIVCPSCGTENPPGFRFCGACAAPLQETPAAREERKVVTVLFADLVGFTSRAERMDPEEVRALQSPYFLRVRSEIESYGGTVEKFIGDAVMALFGAPVAHEDDPERAVRAAVAIRDWIADEQPDLQVRLACTTGEALIVLGARPAEGEGMASGDVVNVAARLQSAAPPNGILVDETTYRATQRAIEYRGHVPVDAKGKAEPIAVWEAVQARSRFGTDVRQIGRTPLFGRTRELDVLVDALERVRQERQLQLVTLVGVPGIGKSRLVWELFQRADALPSLTRWRQGRSLPYGEGVSFWALGEMVKAEAGVLETDRAEEVETKLEESVRALAVEDVDWVYRHLRPLVGLDAWTELGGDRRGEAFAAWRRYVEALADHRPTVLVFEDLHWADDGLLDFVDHVVDWASGVPLLVVATARPELLMRRPNWGGGKSNSTTLSLSPLAAEDTARLVHALLDKSVLAADVQASLLERAAGNPLYAEEFVRLVEERPGEVALPESVQGIIAARLDALAPEEKELVQDAAVYGKVFWLGGLVDGRSRWSVEELLHALERKEFVRRERRSSVAGETEFVFRHALVREVAYEQVPRSRRAQKHIAAASWIGSLGRPDDHAEMLAHHYLNALELCRATGADIAPIAAPARAALGDAGNRAFSLNAFAAAARFYDEALALVDDERERASLLFHLARARYYVGDERRQAALEEARAALLDTGDRARAAEAETLLAELWWHRGVTSESTKYLEHARELVADQPPSEAKARVLAEVSRFHALADRNEPALRVGNEAVEMARALGLAEIEARALNNVGVAKAHLWDLSGLDDLRQSIEIALAASSPEASRGYNNLGAIVFDLGDFRRSVEYFAEAVRVGEQLGNAIVTEYSRTIVIQQQFWLGEWDEALPAFDDLLAAWELGDGHYLESGVRIDRAAARLAQGETRGAVDDIDRAVELARQAEDPQALFPVLGSAARMLAELGRISEAREFARELLSHDAAPTLLYSVLELAFAADALDIHDAVGEHVRRIPELTKWRDAATALHARDFAAAAERFDAIGVPLWAARARLVAGERLAADGRRAEADRQLGQAIEFFREIGASAYARRAESLLAATA